MNKVLYMLLVVACWGCAHDTSTEKHQNNRDRVINVRDKVKEIKIESVLFSSVISPYSTGDYLIISDDRTPDTSIHLFNKNDFSHVRSTAPRGQGPGEIAIMGHIAGDEIHRKFYVADNAIYKIFSYDLDSLIADPACMPTVKMNMQEKIFPNRYLYVNDTLCVGSIIEPIGYSNFKPTVGKWNMNTVEIKLMKYENPGVTRRRFSFAASMEKGIYVECYHSHDLMIIGTLDGELKYNVYGKNWGQRATPNVDYYGSVQFCGDKIYASFYDENLDREKRVKHPA